MFRLACCFQQLRKHFLYFRVQAHAFLRLVLVDFVRDPCEEYREFSITHVAEGVRLLHGIDTALQALEEARSESRVDDVEAGAFEELSAVIHCHVVSIWSAHSREQFLHLSLLLCEQFCDKPVRVKERTPKVDSVDRVVVRIDVMVQKHRDRLG